MRKITKFLIKLLSNLIPIASWRKSTRSKLYQFAEKNTTIKPEYIKKYLKKHEKTSTPPQQLLHQEWFMAYREEQARYIDDIQNNKPSRWTEEIIKISNPGETLIEMGSAMAISSIFLAKHGRIAHALDYSTEMLESAHDIAQKFNIKIQTHHSDIRNPLPFENDTFDTVWSAGLLEHFTDDEIIKFTSEFKRISKKRVVSFVPNAASIAYRIGKIIAEQNGTWKAGLEIPRYTLKDLYMKAGLVDIDEYTIDIQSALDFLPPDPFKNVLSEILSNLPTEDDCHQGYLLVTIGYKPTPSQTA